MHEGKGQTIVQPRFGGQAEANFVLPAALRWADLNIGGESGLKLIRPLLEASPGARILVLTGYASIATAVEAIKLGASHYLAKPSNTDDIIAAFARTEGDAAAPLDGRQSSIKTVEWEHIHQMLVDTDFNISEAARRLGMHRRTLARKLEKRPLR